jgi:hypothetical protein
MTKPRPLALSVEQLALIQQGAKGLPPEWHGRFVDAVADELLPLANITEIGCYQTGDLRSSAMGQPRGWSSSLPSKVTDPRPPYPV